jgi:hypothetical protein
MHIWQHVSSLAWLLLSFIWLFYCALVWAGIARREPKTVRRATAAGVLITCGTFFPLGQQRMWLVISILTIAFGVIGALILMMVKGEGGPTALQALGRARYRSYILCLALAFLAIFVGGLLFMADRPIESTFLACFGFVFALGTLITEHKSIIRHHLKN